MLRTYSFFYQEITQQEYLPISGHCRVPSSLPLIRGFIVNQYQDYRVLFYMAKHVFEQPLWYSLLY